MEYNSEKEGTKMNILVVVDVQNDFVTGPLGSAGAASIVTPVKEKILAAKAAGEKLIFLRDTHEANYMETQEGRRLPVPHTIRGTDGWQIVDELKPMTDGELVIDKPIFGSVELGEVLRALDKEETVEQVTLVGIYTDICVIANAMIAKVFLTEARIVVDASCCAGITDEAHHTALAAMQSCQIDVENE